MLDILRLRDQTGGNVADAGGSRESALQWLVVVTGMALIVFSGVLVLVGGHDATTAGFLLAGFLLVVVGAFARRLVRGKLGLGVGVVEFELAESRNVTSLIASKPEPVSDVAPDQEEDATRWLLAELLLERLLLDPMDPVGDCRFQLYLYDPDREMLLPILEPGHTGPSPGFAPHQGTVGEAWATAEYVVATGPAVWDDTFRLTDEQQARYRDVSAAAAVPVTNAAGRVIGVVSGFSRTADSALASAEGLEVQIFLAEATSRVLVDLLKWFSDGYDDDQGETETQWKAR